MIVELLAGAILATLAIGYVLRPVIRPDVPNLPNLPNPPDPPLPPDSPPP